MMNDNIDQFGRIEKNLRDDSKLGISSIDQSKKIKQSLAEIKEQLIQENFKIETSEKLQSSKLENTEINSSSFITIKELENKINEKLNTIEDKISDLNRSKIHDWKNYSINQIENNIFFELNNQLKPLTNNALLIIDKKNKPKKKSTINS